MKIIKNRHLTVLICILNHDGVVTSEYLAETATASVRTIKSDIMELNQMLNEEGIATIVSTRSMGYYIQPLNIDKFNSFKSFCLKEYFFYKNANIEKMTKRLFISQKLLSNNSLYVQDLADMLFLTKSAIKEDLAWVTAFFESYDVSIHSASNKGLFVRGEEFDLRSLMVDVFCTQYHDIEVTMPVNEFFSMFYTDREYYADVRHAILKCIRESKISFHDIMTKKFATYICLSITRMKNKHIAKVSQEAKAEVIKAYEYTLAKEIVNLEIIKNEYIFLEEEIIQLALLLFCYRDVDLSFKNNVETIAPAYVLQATNLFNKVVSSLQGSYCHTFFTLQIIDVFKNDFISLIYSIYIRSLFDSNKKKRIVTYYELSDYQFSPIAIEISENFMIQLQSFINDSIDQSIITSFISLVDFVLKKVNYQYTKRRLLVTSTGGYVVTRMLADNIKEKFGNYIEYIDVLSIYEMRRINFESYDAIINDMSNLYNFYPIKFVKYNPLAIQDETLNLFSEVFADGYDSHVINHMIEITNHIDSFTCDDYLTFFQLVIYRYGLPEHHQAFTNSFNEKARLLNNYNQVSNVSLIICDYKYTQKEFIDIYIPTTKINFLDCGEVKAIIVVCLKPDYTIIDIKLFNKILQIIWYDFKYIYDIIENKQEAYVQLFRQVITNRFLRK